LAADLTLFLAALLAVLVVRVVWRQAAIRRRYPVLGQIVTVDGLRVHGLTMGQGADVVLIHGASGQLRDLVPLMRRLAPHFRVTAFDRPGLGHSQPLRRDLDSPTAQALHLAGAAQAMGLRRPIVLGQSYGGAVALAWGLKVQGDQAASALVLVSAVALPWPGGLGWTYWLTETALGRALILPLATALVTDAWLERIIPGLFAPGAPPPDYASATGAALALPVGALKANAVQVNGLLRHVVAMAPLYPGLTLPVELVHGSADTVVPAAIHAQPFSARVASARLTLIAEAGHMPHHTHPQAVVDAVLRAAARAGWT
jgi:pimeloyl-ACP methyl ester carboxylesterase